MEKKDFCFDKDEKKLELGSFNQNRSDDGKPK